MTELVRGFRGKLGDSLDISQPFIVKMQTTGGAVYDTCCFGVDAQDRLSDDRYMVFYNQTSSPAGEITFGDAGGISQYTVSLGKLPPSIVKLVFTVSIDGEGTMGQIQSHSISIWQNGAEMMRLVLNGSDFANEKAIIGAEIYLKTVWRIAVVASGFNGGLADLLANYGGELADEPAAAQPAPAPAPQPQAQTAPPVFGQIPPPSPGTPPPPEFFERQTPPPVQPQYGQPAPAPQFGGQPQFSQPTPPPQPQYGQPAPAPQFGGQPQFSQPTPTPPPQPQYGQPAPAPQFGGQPQFSQPTPPPQPQYGQPAPAPQFGGQPQFSQPTPPPQPQYGQPAPAPQFGGQPQFSQPTPPPMQPQYGQPAPAPQFGGQPQYGQPPQQQFRQPAPQAYDPAAPVPPTSAGMPNIPAFRPAPFEVMPLPDIPPIPHQLHDYHTVSVSEALSNVGFELKPVNYDTRPLDMPPPIGHGQAFSYDTVPV